MIFSEHFWPIFAIRKRKRKHVTDGRTYGRTDERTDEPSVMRGRIQKMTDGRTDGMIDKLIDVRTCFDIDSEIKSIYNIDLPVYFRVGERKRRQGKWKREKQCAH